MTREREPCERRLLEADREIWGCGGCSDCSKRHARVGTVFLHLGLSRTRARDVYFTDAGAILCTRTFPASIPLAGRRRKR